MNAKEIKIGEEVFCSGSQRGCVGTVEYVHPEGRFVTVRLGKKWVKQGDRLVQRVFSGTYCVSVHPQCLHRVSEMSESDTREVLDSKGPGRVYELDTLDDDPGLQEIEEVVERACASAQALKQRRDTAQQLEVQRVVRPARREITYACISMRDEEIAPPKRNAAELIDSWLRSMHGRVRMVEA